jgi:hypothetical protein
MAAVGSLHGFEIDCDRELRSLSPARGSLGTVRVRSVSERLLDRKCEVLRLIADPEGMPSYALGRSDGHLLCWHADVGSFLIDGPTRKIAYRPDGGSAEAARWEHRLGSTALPLLAGERGGLPLHASAAAVNGRAVVICGVTGRGKSTLAATLAARGHAPLAEDGVVVRFGDDEPTIWPGLAGSRITAEAAAAIGVGEAAGGTDARGRFFVETRRTATGPMSVGGIAILLERRGDRVELVRPSPARGHRELLAHVLGATPRGPGAFATAARLVEQVPLALLVVPDSHRELGRAAEALEALAGPG